MNLHARNVTGHILPCRATCLSLLYVCLALPHCACMRCITCMPCWRTPCWRGGAFCMRVPLYATCVFCCGAVRAAARACLSAAWQQRHAVHCMRACRGVACGGVWLAWCAIHMACVCGVAVVAFPQPPPTTYHPHHHHHLPPCQIGQVLDLDRIRPEPPKSSQFARKSFAQEKEV